MYEGGTPRYARPTRRDETASQMSYAPPAPSHVKSIRNVPTDLPTVPESIPLYATVNKSNDKGKDTLVQMREKRDETNSTWR